MMPMVGPIERRFAASEAALRGSAMPSQVVSCFPGLGEIVWGSGLKVRVFFGCGGVWFTAAAGST